MYMLLGFILSTLTGWLPALHRSALLQHGMREHIKFTTQKVTLAGRIFSPMLAAAPMISCFTEWDVLFCESLQKPWLAFLKVM